MDLYNQALDLYTEGNTKQALNVIETAPFDQANLNDVRILQGSIFQHLAEEATSSEIRVTYLLATLQCFNGLSIFLAESLFTLAEEINSEYYYKKALREAREGLSIIASSSAENLQSEKASLEAIIISCEEKIASFISEEVNDGIVEEVNDGIVEEVNDGIVEEPKRKTVLDHQFLEEAGQYFEGLSAETKRSFMKVETARFRTRIHTKCGEVGAKTMDQVLKYARKHQYLRFWLCRICAEKYSTSAEFECHLEGKHATKSKPPEMIHEDWSLKIVSGVWKPVEAAAAFDLIKHHLVEVKAFGHVNGWSKEWPVAEDAERSKLLSDIRSLLLLLNDREVFASSIRDCMMRFAVSKLRVSATTTHEVPEQSLDDCRFLETPQSICFLGSTDLNHILVILQMIKYERDDGTTDLVCRAVNSLCVDMLVKEKLSFDSEFSFLLLDKNLLLGGNFNASGDDGIITFLDPNGYCSSFHHGGDALLKWVSDKSQEDESFAFPKPIKQHNLEIWVALLKAVQLKCTTLKAKMDKKMSLDDVDGAIMDATMCLIEKEKSKLVKSLIRLSVFDYRFYLYPQLKEFLKVSIKEGIAHQ